MARNNRTRRASPTSFGAARGGVAGAAAVAGALGAGLEKARRDASIRRARGNHLAGQDAGDDLYCARRRLRQPAGLSGGS